MKWMLVFVFVHATTDKLQGDRHVEVLPSNTIFDASADCLDAAKAATTEWTQAKKDTRANNAEADFHFGKSGSRFVCIPKV